MSGRSVCKVGDLEATGARGFELDTPSGRVAGFVVSAEGEVRAYVNSCPHTGAHLDWAPDRFLTRDRQRIMCSVHGAVFRKDDGFCLEGPCVGRNLRALPVEVQGDEVILDPEVAAQAVREVSPPGL